MKLPFQQMRRQARKALFGDARINRISNENKGLFERAGVKPVPLKVLQSAEQQSGTDVILRKESGGLVALVRLDSGWRFVGETRNKIAPYAYWFNCTTNDVRQIMVNASDGNFPSVADYRYSGTSDEHVLLPDAHFFRDSAYVDTDAFAKDNPVSWDARTDDIVWRGAANGVGEWTLDAKIVAKPGVMQRLHMARKCQELNVDFRFVTKPYQHDYYPLERAGLIGGFVPTHDWGSKKFAIDIDGFSNAWCNFMQRLKLGCCVLKVDSPFGYRQWYYHHIKPWEHFVPIKADLSDLEEQLDWVRTHSDQARQIAANGQDFARELTFESESRYAVEAIEKRALTS